MMGIRGSAEPGGHKRFRRSVLESLLVGVEQGCTILFRTNPRSERAYSHADIVGGAMAFAEHMLADRTLAFGDRVVIVLPTGPEFLWCFYGTIMAGAVPVPVAPPMMGTGRHEYYSARFRAILANSGAKYVVAGDVDLAQLKTFLPRELPGRTVVSLAGVRFDRKTDLKYYDPTPQDLCFIQYTSGSTSEPKGVPLTHGNVNANIEGIGGAVAVTDQDTCASWMPLCHDMGLVGGTLLPIHYSFSKLVLMSPILMARPYLWLKAISDHRLTFSPGNNFAFSRSVHKVTESEVSSLDLSCWRIAFNGSEPISVQAVERFAEKFARAGYKKEAMLPCYGLAEATLGVTFGRYDEAPRSIECCADELFVGATARVYDGDRDRGKMAIRLVSLGKPIECLEVQIRGASGESVPEGQLGRIYVRGDSVMGGYYSTAGTRGEGLEGGWLYTGDIGFMLEGELYFTAREKDLIAIRGKKYSPVDVETIVNAMNGRKVECAAFGAAAADGAEALRIVVETEERDGGALQNLSDRIQRALAENLEIRADTIVFVPPKSIPRTFNGKVRRSECARRFRDGAGS